MTAVFADTSYYLALFNEDDVCHEKAEQFSREQSIPIVLTEFILLELGNAFCRGQARRRFVDLVADLRGDPLCRIVPVSEDLFEAGLRLYAERHDKEWSLTDCTSFAVMKKHRLTQALTTDRHFGQAGFKVLLR
jgi:hypothetical protein